MSTQVRIDAEGLEKLTGPELVNLFNELCPETPVKRFSDRKAGISRILKLVSETNMEPEELVQRSSPEPEPTPVTTPTGRKVLYEVREKITQHRPNSRRGLVVRMLQREQGATREELMEATDWPSDDLRINIRLINIFLGHGIEEDAEGRLYLVGKPVIRKKFTFPRKPEVKDHRSGTKRARTIELLRRPEGAKLEDIQAVTGWTFPQAMQGIALVHSYLGYGLEEDDDGNIKIF